MLRVDYKKNADYSVSKSWQSLDELAKQAGYRVMFRFNLITEAKPDAKEAFTVVDWERIKLDHGMKDFVQNPESSLKRLCNVDADEPKDAEPQLRKKLADLHYRYGDNVKILVEVILHHRHLEFDIKRTLAPSSYTQDNIAGCWLRTAVEIGKVTNGLLDEENNERGQDLKAGSKQVLMTGITKSKDLSFVGIGDALSNTNQAGNSASSQSGVNLSDGSNSKISVKVKKGGRVRKWDPKAAPFTWHFDLLPSSDPTITTGKTKHQDTNNKKQDPDFKPLYQVIGLDDNLKCLPFATPAGKNDYGLWSETRLGCAGSDYVRDFAHFILQYKLPKPIKPVSVNECIVIRDLTIRIEEEGSGCHGSCYRFHTEN